MDDMVLSAQRFINTAYDHVSQIPHVEENGRTSWAVMYALTRCLQYELGIDALSDNFGPGTLGNLQSDYPILNAETVPSPNFCRIIQSGLYCKGYDGGGIDGKYSSRVSSSVAAMKTDMGVDRLYPGGDLTPKVFKGLLNMDPYVLVNGGSTEIRDIQQWLNSRYVDRSDFFIIPCGGHHSRTVAKSMLLAIQYELGMPDGVANGVFGPGTRAGLKEHIIYVGSSGTWALLFSAAMVLNERAGAAFNGTFTQGLSDATGAFQAFCMLPVTKVGDYQTWASLLVSTGDPTRDGTACDGVTKVTPARADTLKAHGYKYIGRYLSNPSSTSLPEKAIQPGELQTIAGNGLRVFPIYQTFGGSADYFSYIQGKSAALAAANAAKNYGFKNGTRIFFAVDFDALNYHVTDNIIPHFRGVRDGMLLFGNPYEIGVYGTRNVCTRVGGEGLSTASFVSDMSTGYSGNYGYPLPQDWAYDQIATIGIGSGDGYIEIDNNIASGRDTGQNKFNQPRTDGMDTAFDMAYWNALHADIGNYMESLGFPNDSGWRIFTHSECLETIMSHDALITRLSRELSMRKSLIQTSAYWEMRHYDTVDQAADAAVVLYHTGVGGDMVPKRDSSTGIAQIFGAVGVKSRNNSIRKGILSGNILDPEKDADIWTVWQKLNQDNAYSVATVAHVHIWDVDKPGEEALRPIALDYTDYEIFQLLRRYQGPKGSVAVEHARQRMGLYQIFEKYNTISRNQ